VNILFQINIQDLKECKSIVFWFSWYLGLTTNSTESLSLSNLRRDLCLIVWHHIYNWHWVLLYHMYMY